MDSRPPSALFETAADTSPESYRLFHDLPCVGSAVWSPDTGRLLKGNHMVASAIGWPP